MVHLHERDGQLGGQTRLAQLLNTRAEFGGITTNLSREADLAGVTIHRRSDVDMDVIRRDKPDAVILATGSLPHMAPMEGEAAHVIHAVDLLSGKSKSGARAVIYDWHGEWLGSGIAERLASEGVHVRLAVNAACAAANLQTYIRFETVARLHKAGVEVIPWLRLYGADGNTVYFTHTPSREAVIMDDVDTLVLATPNIPNDTLSAALESEGIEHHLIGDCLTPRTAEEAVYEGLKAGMAV